MIPTSAISTHREVRSILGNEIRSELPAGIDPVHRRKMRP